mmetsp:Transcript_11505/g.34106  ORF Transcript_11505/g.34106 Transcript_11505/m.34106 type:complete len:346 (-) Transcript_11505:222-1259(-)
MPDLHVLLPSAQPDGLLQKRHLHRMLPSARPRTHHHPRGMSILQGPAPARVILRPAVREGGPRGGPPAPAAHRRAGAHAPRFRPPAPQRARRRQGPRDVESGGPHAHHLPVLHGVLELRFRSLLAPPVPRAPCHVPGGRGAPRLPRAERPAAPGHRHVRRPRAAPGPRGGFGPELRPALGARPAGPTLRGQGLATSQPGPAAATGVRSAATHPRGRRGLLRPGGIHGRLVPLRGAGRGGAHAPGGHTPLPRGARARGAGGWRRACRGCGRLPRGLVRDEAERHSCRAPAHRGRVFVLSTAVAPGGPNDLARQRRRGSGPPAGVPGPWSRLRGGGRSAQRTAAGCL